MRPGHCSEAGAPGGCSIAASSPLRRRVVVASLSPGRRRRAARKKPPFLASFWGPCKGGLQHLAYL